MTLRPMLAGCANHTPVLQLPVLELEHPTFAATVAAYTGSPVVGGNRVEVLLNGDEIFPAKLRAIRSARRSINYAQYVFEEGRPAEDVAQALAERCRAGVTVNVLLDAVGALSLPTEYRDVMTSAGCRVENFRPLSPFAIDKVNNRNHRRILVVDGRMGIHAGPSETEMQTFILHPAAVMLPTPLTHPVQLYPHFAAYGDDADQSLRGVEGSGRRDRGIREAHAVDG